MTWERNGKADQIRDQPGDRFVGMGATLRTKGGNSMPLMILIIIASQKSIELDTVFVTATRYPSALRDIAPAVRLLDRKDLETLKPSTLAEALNNLAGIDIREYGLTGSFAGVNLRGVPSSAVLLLIDGQPMNSVLTGVGDLNAIMIEDVERVEIIKGPASSLYGANGLGGVVNVITRRHFDQTAAAIELGSAGPPDDPAADRTIFGRFGSPLGDLNVCAAAGYRYAAGYRSNSDFTGYHGRFFLGLDRPAWAIGGDVKYSNREYGVPGPRPRVDSINPPPIFGDSTATSLFDREQDYNTLAAFDFLWRPGADLQWHNKIFGNDQQIQYHTRFWNYSDTVDEGYDWHTYTLGLQTSLRVKVAGADLITGIDARYDTLETKKTSMQTGDTLWSASQGTVGAWFELKKTIGRFHLNPSFRLDWNSGYGIFLSPMLGSVYAAADNLQIKFSLGRAFRAPGFNDLYSPLYGNPDLKPETGNAAELRFEYAAGGMTQTGLSLFSRVIHDRIAWMPTQDGLWRPLNVNRIKYLGLEWETHGQYRNLILMDNELTCIWARQRNRELIYSDGTTTDFAEVERPAAFIAPLSLASRWTVNLTHGVGISLAFFYTSARHNYYENWDGYPNITRDTKTLAAYTRFDLGVTATIYEYITISAGCKNLLDVQYATQFGNTIQDLDYPMPPRTIYLQLSVK